MVIKISCSSIILFVKRKANTAVQNTHNIKHVAQKKWEATSAVIHLLPEKSLCLPASHTPQPDVAYKPLVVIPSRSNSSRFLLIDSWWGKGGRCGWRTGCFIAVLCWSGSAGLLTWGDFPALPLEMELGYEVAGGRTTNTRPYPLSYGKSMLIRLRCFFPINAGRLFHDCDRRMNTQEQDFSPLLGWGQGADCR